MDIRRRFGNHGENLAADYLEAQGLLVLEKQYKRSSGEIDLICQDGDEVVFVEVKTRNTSTFGHPEDSVTPKKIRNILRTAERYLLEKKLGDVPWRIDVIAIEMFQKPPFITHLKNIDIPEVFW